MRGENLTTLPVNRVLGEGAPFITARLLELVEIELRNLNRCLSQHFEIQPDAVKAAVARELRAWRPSEKQSCFHRLASKLLLHVPKNGYHVSNEMRHPPHKKPFIRRSF